MTSHAGAEQRPLRTDLNLYGMPGLVDLPNAASMTDADLTTTISGFGGTMRYTLAFQISPRLTGAFRYAYFGDADDPFSEDDPYWDRSFDLHYRFLDEGTYRPALAIGVRDFIGTGLYSGEYVVASKTLGYGLRATAGIGWGRLAGRNSFDNPFGLDDRPDTGPDQGGTATFDQFFRGPASFFGGIEWQPNDKLSFALEYSADEYEAESDRFGTIDPQSPLNVSARYTFGPGASVGAHYMYGAEVGLSFNFTINPTRSPTGLGFNRPPPPFVTRPDRAGNPQAWGTEWVMVENAETTIRENVSKALDPEGIQMIGLRAGADELTIEFENQTYARSSQALGRVARVLSNMAPASIEHFVLVPVEKGMPTTAIRLTRSELEQAAFESDAVPRSLASTQFADAQGLARPEPEAGLFPRFRWGFGPYAQTSLFDPKQPFLIDIGAELSAEYEPVQGLSFSGAIRQKVIGNLDDSRLIRPQVPGGPPIVRLDAYEYNQYSDLTIPYLTADVFYRPAANLYGRVTAGLLERMYGGASAELLWQDPHSPLALGVEINYARKREYEQRFAFQDYETVTGHVSAYYAFNNGYLGQVDVGRYLAEDWGATFTFSRVFDNGTEIGAYATLTDVPFEEFGEGSFDKGIRITFPLEFLSGRPSASKQTVLLQPVLRDGGARLHVRNRLYETVRTQSAGEIAGSWGRFWR